jgi:hypothetical protein
MKPLDHSKTIGLVRYLDGSYGPSNSKSAMKLESLYLKAGLLSWPTKAGSAWMFHLREIAAKHGYKIMTSTKAL